MSGQGLTAPADALLQELLDGLTGPAGPGALRSLGLVGCGTNVPRPPAHCLSACLDGNPDLASSRGCPWLTAAAQGRVDSSCLQDGRCPRGFAVSARQVAMQGQAALVLAVDGPIVGSPAGNVCAGVLDTLEAASRLVERVDWLSEENVGLADEVLRTYEQLNLIFDFTQQITHITDVVEIEHIVLGRLGSLLGAERVYLLSDSGRRLCCNVEAGVVAHEGADGALDGQLADQIEHVRRARQVCVASGDEGQFILGPLLRLDEQVDVVLATRPPDKAEFTSGDMLLVESVLTFGGQIITNSELHEMLRRMSVEVTRALVSAIDQKDHYTSGHSERVGFLAHLTGRRMGLPLSELKVLEWAGLLHDVGKIGIPEDILNKPGRLTEAEFDRIKRHSVMGHEILKPIASLEHVLAGVRHHHEAPDGSGYPDGLKSDEIPLVARIIHTADVFDALSSARSYRGAYSIEAACDIIRKDAGTKIDAEVAQVFLEAIAAFRAARPDEFAAMFLPAEENSVEQP